MAVSDSNPVQKPHVYDLLNRLNAAFARVNRNMEELEEWASLNPKQCNRSIAYRSSYGQKAILACSRSCGTLRNGTWLHCGTLCKPRQSRKQHPPEMAGFFSARSAAVTEPPFNTGANSW